MGTLRAGKRRVRPVMEPDLTRLPSFATYARARTACECGGAVFEWRTSGDGGLLQVCERCGLSWGVGRFWIDAAIGPRSESVWSSRGARE
jgi:hypothetical protein